MITQLHLDHILTKEEPTSFAIQNGKIASGDVETILITNNITKTTLFSPLYITIFHSYFLNLFFLFLPASVLFIPPNFLKSFFSSKLLRKVFKSLGPENYSALLSISLKFDEGEQFLIGFSAIFPLGYAIYSAYSYYLANQDTMGHAVNVLLKSNHTRKQHPRNLLRKLPDQKIRFSQCDKILLLIDPCLFRGTSLEPPSRTETFINFKYWWSSLMEKVYK